MTKEVFYLWLDLETTGLDLGSDSILEAGWFATNGGLEQVSPTQSVLIRTSLKFSSPQAAAMHARNGLLEDLNTEQCHHISHLGQMLRETVVELDGDVQLAGSGVHFDRLFLERDLPDFFRLLHYRYMDVSIVERYVRDICGIELPPVEPAHRALPDAVSSLERAIKIREVLREQVA